MALTGPTPDPADARTGEPTDFTDPADPTGRPAGPAADDESLPCGASLALLWEEGPAPDHAACPHCAAARSDLAALDRTVRAAVTAHGDVPDLAARVMDLVRTELRPGPLVPLEEPDGWITETAAARLFRHAAQSLPGVAAGSCRVAAVSGRTAVRGRLPREPLRVMLEIAVDLSRTVPDAVAAVRERVLGAAAEHIGLELAAVDVAVVDLLEPSAVPDRRLA